MQKILFNAEHIVFFEKSVLLVHICEISLHSQSNWEKIVCVCVCVYKYKVQIML